MTIDEMETHAYVNGDTSQSDLLARIADLELQVEELTDKLDDAESDSLARWEKNENIKKEWQNEN